jgi:hypothetical protein
MSLIKALYIIAIGLLIAAFIGFGIDTFYPSPKMPEYPTELQYQTSDKLSSAQQQKQKDYDNQMKDYQKKTSDYNQNLSVILIAFAVVILAASLAGLAKLDVIGDGATLGGVFTLLYGIGRAFGSEEAKFRFIAVTAALVIILGLTYWRFLKTQFPLASLQKNTKKR